MDLIEFYRKVATSLGLIVSDDDFLQVKLGKSKTTLTADGKMMTLPTKYHIDSAVDIDDEGNPIISKIMYNPLNEDVIKRDSLSLTKTKDMVERRLALSFAAIGELLLTLASNTTLQKKTPMELNKFLMSLNSADNANIKSVVDPKSVDLWAKIYSKAYEVDPGKSFTKLYLKKGGTYQGVKYNRLAVCSLPIYEMLSTADRDTPIFDIKLRNKDIKVFKLIHEFVFDTMDENEI